MQVGAADAVRMVAGSAERAERHEQEVVNCTGGNRDGKEEALVFDSMCNLRSVPAGRRAQGEIPTRPRRR